MVRTGGAGHSLLLLPRHTAGCDPECGCLLPRLWLISPPPAAQQGQKCRTTPVLDSAEVAGMVPVPHAAWGPQDCPWQEPAELHNPGQDGATG